MTDKNQIEATSRVIVENMRLDAMEPGETLQAFMLKVAERVKTLEGATVSTANCTAFVNDMISLGFIDGDKPKKGWI